MAGRCSILDSQFGNCKEFSVDFFHCNAFFMYLLNDEDIEVYDLPFYWRYWANSMVVAD